MIQMQHKMDQHMIHCISRAVQAQKPGRALELTTLLYLPSSIDTAIKLAVKVIVFTFVFLFVRVSM